ncbi:MAG: nucleotidyltransferase domain-containing protein [Deltaproteobacteria bacterium]|nr:nucleotidyltransferase domain-containing protein [Deltaproteobacteria bacterium]
MHSLIAEHRAKIADVCRRYRVRRLEVFGSAARGDDFEPDRSDVDFLVEFEEDDEGTSLKEFFELRDELSELVGRPVDLVMLTSVRNPYVRSDIERSRELLYAA